MKNLTVEIDRAELDRILAQMTPGDGVILTDGERQIALEPLPSFDPYEDSPELEKELLKAVNSPISDYSRGDLEKIAAGIRPGKPRQ